MSESNLRFADRVWQTYTSDDPSQLYFATIPHPIFQYLSGAVCAYLERFSDQSGFNEIEKEILKKISDAGSIEVDKLVRHMLQWQKHYGFGDLQYYYHVKSLSPFLHIGEQLSLNEKGKAALQNGIDRKSYSSLDLPVGGTGCSRYFRDKDTLRPL